jgi:hypothetical protein
MMSMLISMTKARIPRSSIRPVTLHGFTLVVTLCSKFANPCTPISRDFWSHARPLGNDQGSCNAQLQLAAKGLCKAEIFPGVK